MPSLTSDGTWQLDNWRCSKLTEKYRQADKLKKNCMEWCFTISQKNVWRLRHGHAHDIPWWFWWVFRCCVCVWSVCVCVCDCERWIWWNVGKKTCILIYIYICFFYIDMMFLFKCMFMSVYRFFCFTKKPCDRHLEVGTSALPAMASIPWSYVLRNVKTVKPWRKAEVWLVSGGRLEK